MVGMGSFKFASCQTCRNHDTEVMPQLLSVRQIDHVHEKMVVMALIATVVKI